jgi:hypothetical protein
VVEARGASFEVGDVSVRPNHQVSSFDLGYEREEVALVVPGTSATRAMPMRFTGDGAQGFAALLYPNERMVFSRQGVGATGDFDFAFSASPAQTLRCGLLGSDGAVLASADCASGLTSRVSYSGAVAPVAAFIEGAATGGAQIDNVSVFLSPGACSAATCASLGKNCGTVADGCGANLDCGACPAPSSCGGSGTPNVCGCTAETDAQLCSRVSKNCGSVTGADNCGTSRTVSSCGSCTSPNTCGGGGTANVCGKPACTPETDAQFCSRVGKNCGSVTGADNCGTSRTVSSCGSCTSPNTCGGGGTANVCGSNAPACQPAYAQNMCLTYFQSVKVSRNGHNWLCSNGNCANCATFASCAPGGTGCPWGVVWTDQGACK